MKNRKLIVFSFLLLLTHLSFAQNQILVSDLFFEIDGNSTKEFYYSFAKGDVIVIDFELTKGKGVDFEVIELPNQLRTNKYTAQLTNFRINVPSTKVYLFRITNGHGKKRCSLNINRIPKSQETRNFSTSWKWGTIYDTTYTTYREDSLVRHDTVHYTETVKEVVSKEISEIVLVERFEKIQSNASKLVGELPRAYMTVKLPQNKQEEYSEKKVYGWAYWIGVGENSTSFWNQNKSLVAKSVAKVAGLSGLGALVVGGITYLVVPPNGEDDVEWGIVANADEIKSFMDGGKVTCIRKGIGSGTYGVFVDKHTQGTYYIVMHNHNHFRPIKVNVKASAIIETTTYKDVDYARTKIVPKYVTLIKKRSNISSYRVRVPVDYIE